MASPNTRIAAIGSMPLPEHVAGIVVAADGRACDLAQAQQGFRAVDDETGMHLNGDCGRHDWQRTCARSIQNGVDNLVPLPGQYLEILRRPRTGYPVRSLRFRRVTRAAGKIDDLGYAQLLSQQNRLAVHFLKLLRLRRVGMQRDCHGNSTR